VTTVPRSRRLAVLSVVVGVTVALDHLTKAAARAYLASRPPISLCGDTIRLALGENAGAFMGLGAGLPPQLRTLLFGVLAAVMLAALTAYLLAARALGPMEVFVGALMVAGGLGNLIDRLTRQGRVTDFLNLGIGPLRTGVFNVADVAITLGAAWMMVLLSRGPRRGVEAAHDDGLSGA
jgi:signal peptidase II